MSAFKLIVVAIALANPRDEAPKPLTESFATYDACYQAQEMYRSVAGVKAKCIPDGALAEHLPPRYDYQSPRPNPLPRYDDGPAYYPPNYEMPLPPLRRPAGPEPWPQ